MALPQLVAYLRRIQSRFRGIDHGKIRPLVDAFGNCAFVWFHEDKLTFYIARCSVDDIGRCLTSRGEVVVLCNLCWQHFNTLANKFQEWVLSGSVSNSVQIAPLASLPAEILSVHSSGNLL